jgi:hypothetical protein
MRDQINEKLAGTHIKVSGAQFTRAGNVAVTPLAPCTAMDMLRYTDVIGGCVAHRQRPSSLVVEADDPWPSVVVRGVQILRGEDVWEVEQALCEELGRWNPVLQTGVKEVRVMRKTEDTSKGGRGTMRIAFKTVEGKEQALRGGICAFGERCWASQYRGRTGG